MHDKVNKINIREKFYKINLLKIFKTFYNDISSICVGV